MFVFSKVGASKCQQNMYRMLIVIAAVVIVNGWIYTSRGDLIVL